MSSQQTILILGFGWFLLKRLLTFLRFFQQEEYNETRFLRWLWQHRLADRWVSLALLIGGALLLLIGKGNFSAILYGLILALFGFKEPNPCRRGKKPLVLTARARRILVVSWLVAVLACFLLVSGEIWDGITLLLFVQATPLALIVGNLLLAPLEGWIQQRFKKEGRRRLQEYHPYVVGITGSYGKTSIKHLLGHILEMKAPTLVTPGSVNTPMGITRIIREKLHSRHLYFIVEMGAYGKGSIQRLCELVRPRLGVIGRIGPAHYERFRTLEQTAKAKMELFQFVEKQGGKTLLHENLFPFDTVQSLISGKPVMQVGSTNKADYQVAEFHQTREGLTVILVRKKQLFHCQVPLFGRHQAENIALAFAAACEIGLEPEIVVTALKSMPQVPHRLSVSHRSNGTIWIDDAYNSNPDGFLSALEVLDLLRQGAGRRILVTPGVVELGSLHAEVHRQLGEKAFSYADIVLAVQPERIPTFCDAFLQGGGEKPLIGCQNFKEAENWLQKNLRTDDVVLLENDLPDIYEALPRI